MVDGSEPPRLVGLVTLEEALKARVRHLEEEQRRETVLPLRVMIPFARLRRRGSPLPNDNATENAVEPDRQAS